MRVACTFALLFFVIALGEHAFTVDSINDDQSNCSLWTRGKFSRPLIVIDGFYANPDQVRSFALSQNFNVSGNYPGHRTRDFATNEHKEVFENILGKKITYWPTSKPGSLSYNGAFQLALSKHRSWIHRDKTDHSAIVFLSPNAPLHSGTSLYRHTSTGSTYETSEHKTLMDRDSSDVHAWTVTDEVTNIYNRLVIFDGRRSHMSNPYFGTDFQTGRLFQTFFFDVEK